jgi:hypothetical protein
MPTEAEIKEAFKEETGREPTAKELEEFKSQASGPEPDGINEADTATDEEIK